MNKTLTVNIGGLVFHIDENAYRQLDHYLKTIKASFSIEEQEEIIHDIELRIAELLSEKIKEQNQVVILADIHQIINIMGKPEDYILEEDDQNKQFHYHYTTTSKKLYRDQQDKILGGVLSGLGHYFGIDAVWMRIIFALLFFFYGTGFLIYIILWIIIPPAKTISQILEMKREPVTVSSIEKEVKESFEYVNKKFNEFDYQKVKKTTKNAGQKSARIISYTIGGILIAISSITILSLLTALIGILINRERVITRIAQSSFPINDIMTYGYPFWLGTLVMISMCLLPFIGLYIIGLRLIYTNIKYVGLTIFGLFILWIISLAAFSIPMISMGVNKIESTVEKTMASESIEVNLPQDIEIIVVTPEFFTSDKTTTQGFEATSDLNTPNSILNIDLKASYASDSYFKVNTNKSFNVQIINSSVSYASESQSLQYHLIEDKLIISNIYLSPDKEQERNIVYTIYIPHSHRVKLHSSALNFTNQDLVADQWYTMQQDNELSCDDCK